MGEIDYKDVQTLTKLTTNRGRLFSRKRSGNCARHQRSARVAIKRSRFIGLMPFVG
jgi:small subunit ribosomal protein S18